MNKKRARDLGIAFHGQPGLLNAITDIAGVEVGHCTIIEGEGEHAIRTGVTSIFPRGRAEKFSPVYANWYSLNGNGEMTGTTWVSESGFLETPILLTNTNSVGVVRDTLLKWFVDVNWYGNENWWYTYPVVAETFDGFLNDIYGFHVQEHHVREAIDNAKIGAVAEGNVGGGTGMVTLGYKGGIGTSSRQIQIEGEDQTVGVLVQSNFGDKKNLTISGVALGEEFKDLDNSEFKGPVPNRRKQGDGSIVVIVATDAALLPHQLKRLTERVSIGIGLVGGRGENGSGDIFLAFSTANEGAFSRTKKVSVESISNDLMDEFFNATVQAVEEAIVNALIAAETMVGKHGNTVYALQHDKLLAALEKSHRLVN